MDQPTTNNNQQQTQAQPATPNQERNNLEHLPHPNLDNQTTRRMIDIWFYHLSIPVLVFVLLIVFDNKMQFDARQMIKNSGLLAIILLCITLIVGPISKYIKFFNYVKVHRKSWGLFAFFAAAVHTVLVVYRFYEWDFIKTFSFSNPRVLPVWSGLIALFILFLIAITSNKLSMGLMGAKKWKLLQTTSYIALIFVLIHFVLAETRNNVTSITRPFEYFSLTFAFVTLVLRIWVFIKVEISKRKNKQQVPVVSPVSPEKI